MRFTQFMFPRGRRADVEIEMPPEIETMARAVVDAGWNFEIECHPDTQLVYMDCCNSDEAIANRICRNGPTVPKKVAEMVREAHAVVQSRLLQNT